MLIDSGVWPGRVAELERHVAQRVALAVGDAHRLELGLGDRRVDDLGAGRLGQLEVAGQEVGVEVRLDDELDREAGIGSASARYSATSRCGSTTTARPVVSSPIRYDACDRQSR